MFISKEDSFKWFRFFAEISAEGEQLTNRQNEIALAVLSQIELAAEHLFEIEREKIKNLHSLNGRTLFVGDSKRFPKGCVSCLMGTGLSAIRKTNRCDAACPFCYDYGQLDEIPPIGEGMWEIGGSRLREEDLELLLSIQKKPSGVAYVYLEPFMEIEKYYNIVKKFNDYGIYQHLYTNGIHAQEEQLRALGEAGLNEIRFNLGATMCADAIIEKIAIARKYIPMVGIETPMTPELYEAFLQKKDKILKTGLDFINFAELHLNPNNLENYMGENLYMYRHGYVSPISSRLHTLKMMRLADDEGWETVVHDCSNRTKFARDFNLKAAEGGWFGQSAYGSEFDEIPYEAFLPVLSDESFHFLREEPLPSGYRIGDVAL